MAVTVPPTLRIFWLLVLATSAKWRIIKAPVSRGVPDRAHQIINSSAFRQPFWLSLRPKTMFVVRRSRYRRLTLQMSVALASRGSKTLGHPHLSVYSFRLEQVMLNQTRSSRHKESTSLYSPSTTGSCKRSLNILKLIR